MKTVITILIIYLVALFSVTLLPRMSIFSAMPKIVLVLSLLFLFHKDFKNALIWASVGGLFLDFLDTGFPYNILLSTAIILLSWYLIKRFFESSNIYIFLIFCFFGGFLYDLVFFGAHHLNPLTYPVVLNAIYTTIAGFIFALIYVQFQKRVSKKLTLVHWEPDDRL